MFNQKKNVSAIFIAVLLLNLFFGVPTGLPSAFAATSIGNNITTDGTVTVNAPGQLTINGLLQYTTGAAANLFLKSSDAAGNAVWAGETDPVFLLSAASGIVAGDITNWDTAYGWGDHSTFGYLTSETDPVYGAWLLANPNIDLDSTNDFTPTTLFADYGFTDNSGNWNSAFGWGDHSTFGYLTSETDPTAVLKATFTTAGDLLVGTGSGIYNALGVGSNG